MTTLDTNTTSVFRPHPLARIEPGDIIWTWCSRSGDRERHLWTGSKLICLHCRPECDPAKESEE